MPLYISYENKNKDYKNITFAVELIEQNLRTILRTLERLKDRQGIGKIPDSVQSAQQKALEFEHLDFPNTLL